MPRRKIPPSAELRGAMAAIVVFLRGCWPNAVTVAARDLSGGVSDSLFLEAALTLQDEGAIMYEAMLAGVEAGPCLRDAILTRKGQMEASGLERPA